MKRIIWFLETVLLIIISLPLAILPLKAAYVVGEFLSIILFYLFSRRRKIAIDNIQKILDVGGIASELSAVEIAKKTYANFGKTLVEIVKLYYGLGDKIVRDTIVNGKENFQKIYNKNHGAIFITGHCGNWEVFTAVFARVVGKSDLFGKAHVIARPLDNIYLHKIISRVRRANGCGLIDKKGAARGLFRALKHGDVVGVLIDQASNSSEGFIVDFLGRRAWATRLPAVIAAKTGAPVIPIFIHREKNHHVVKVHPELKLLRKSDEASLQQDTQTISNAVADYIKQYPTEWLWTHQRWKRT